MSLQSRVSTYDNAPELAGSEALGNNTETAASYHFPAPSTVRGRVLGALLRGDRMTHLDCWKRFGSSRLAHHIYSLRLNGWTISMDEVGVKTSDAGRGAIIGIYYLSPSIIEDTRERGKLYGLECLQVERQRKEAAYA